MVSCGVCITCVQQSLGTNSTFSFFGWLTGTWAREVSLYVRHGTHAVYVSCCPSHNQKEENPNPDTHMEEQPQRPGTTGNQHKRRRIFTCNVKDSESPGDNGSQTTTKSSKRDSTTAKTDARRTGTPWPCFYSEYLIILLTFLLMDATQKYGYVLIWKILKLTIHWPGIIKP